MMSSRLLTLGILASLTLLTAQAPINSPSIWSLSPQQRQKLLAEQQAQTSNSASIHFQEQLRNAYATQQRAQLNLLQSQRELVRSQQDNFQARQNLTAAAMEAGRASVQADLARDRMSKQTDMVVNVAKTWQPAKTHSASAAEKPSLADPFAPVDQPSESPETMLNRAIEGSCLKLDREHGVAETTASCSWQNVAKAVPPDLYPVLPDGSLLDSADRVKQFLRTAATTSDKISLLRPEGELVRLR